MKKVFLYIFALTALLSACHNAKVPEQFTDIKNAPNIYPDYKNVTIPVNIAPLTFEFSAKFQRL